MESDQVQVLMPITTEPHIHADAMGKYELRPIDSKVGLEGWLIHLKCSYCKAIIHGVGTKTI